MLDRLQNFIANIASKGFFHLFFSNILIAFSLFGAQFLVAKWLSADDLGIIKSWQTYISIVSIFAGIGLSASVLKIVAKKEKADICIYFVTCLFILFVASCVIWLLFIILINTLGIINNPELIIYLNRYSFIIIFTAMNALFFAFYNGQRKIKELSRINTLYRGITALIIIISTYFFGINGFFIALIFGALMTLIVYLLLNRDILKLKFFNKKILFSYPTINYSVNGIISNGVSQLATGVDILLLNYYAVETSLIGYYSFALLIMMGLSMFTGTITQIITPYFTLNEDNIFVLRKHYLFYQKLAVIAFIVIFLLSLWLVPIISNILFGRKYVQSEEFFFPVFLLWLIKSSAAISIALFSGVGKMTIISKGQILLLLLNIIFSYIGYYYFGVLGLSYFLLISAFVFLLYNIYHIKKYLSQRNENKIY